MPATFSLSDYKSLSYKCAYTILVSPITYHWIKIINQKAQSVFISLQQIVTYLQFKVRKAKVFFNMFFNQILQIHYFDKNVLWKKYDKSLCYNFKKYLGILEVTSKTWTRSHALSSTNGLTQQLLKVSATFILLEST